MATTPNGSQRRGRAQDDASTVRKPDFRELGLSGTRLYAGLVAEETVPALQGARAFTTFNGMRFDATGAALLKAISLPIRSARWYVEPASDSPADVEKADFVHSVLFEFGSQSFDDVCRLALDGMLAFGFDWHEIIYAYIDQGPFAGKIGWDQLAWRSQNTKWRFNMDYINGRRQLVSITQLPPPYYEQVEIPKSKSLLWVNDLEGDRWDGISIFRPAYRNYFFRENLQRIQAIGLERAYMSLPVITLPQGYSDEERDLAKQIVETIRTDEQAGVTMPDNLTLTPHTWQLNDTAMSGAIAYHTRQMLASALAQFLDLGSGGSGATGSYALSNDQSELFLYAVNAKANYFAEVLNLEPGIPSLIDINYADAQRAQMPRLTHGDIGQRSLDTLGRTLQALAAFGFLTPDDVTEDRLRQMLDLPEREQTIGPDALKDLAQQVFPTTTDVGYSAHGARLPSPLETAAKAAQAKSAPPPGQSSRPSPPNNPPAPAQSGNGATPSETQMAEQARFSEAQQKLQEVLVRRRWERPKGRPTEEQRNAMRTTEKFTEQLEEVWADMRHSTRHKPPKPSEIVAQRRRPYVIRGADSGSSAKPSDDATVTSQRAIAGRYRNRLREALRPGGKRHDSES